jgi:uncharacterized repeat protein (TIGR02543 family)/LPXTG-motif cell wall-anchored protein
MKTKRILAVLICVLILGAMFPTSVFADEKTEGSSLYTVEFSYNGLQYVLSGGKEVPLSEILEVLGLSGEVTAVQVSDDSLLSASDETGEWVIASLRPFQSDEWMKVTIGGAEYEIKVTDNVASGDGWNIDDDGCLHITGPVTYTSAPPWNPYMSQITSVIAESGSSTNNAKGLFCHGKNITSIDISELDTSAATDMQNMFDDCPSLKTVNLSNLNTSNVTTFYNLFRGCNNLESLDLSSFDTQKVGNMSGMFTNCSKLTALDLSNFQTPALNKMQAMFFGRTALETLDVSNFDTSNVTTMSQTFYNCKALTALDIKHFNTSNVTSMYGMFDGCEALTDLDVSKFDTSKVTAMSNMFRNCEGLTSIDVTCFDTSKVTAGLTGMFENCISLTEIDLSHLDISKSNATSGMLRGCKSLEKISATADIFNNEKKIIIRDIHNQWKNEDTDEIYSSEAEIGDISDISTITRAYTITVNVNGNGTAWADKTVASEGDVIALAAVPGTGYHFKEWQSSGVTLMGETFIMGKADATITAIFEPDIHTVSFDVQGHGIAPVAQYVKHGDKASDPGALTEDGFAFDGWYADAACNVAFDFDSAVTADTTIYAKWKPNTPAIYTVVGYMNDGPDGAIAEVRINGERVPENAGTGGTLKIAAGTEDVTVEVKFNRGYTFGRWFDGIVLRWGGVQSGSTNIDNSRYPASIDMPDSDWFETEDQELYLIIQTQALPMFDIDVQTDGQGSASASLNPALEGEEVILTATPDEGYRFKEWLSSDVEVTDGKLIMPARSITVTAVFEAIPAYTVTFDMGGHGAQIAAQFVEEGNRATRPADPSANGYTFGGWYSDSAFKTAFDFDTAIHADTTVYAKWVMNSGKQSDSQLPQTGDNTNPLFWVLLLAISGTAMVGAAILSRKRKKHN